jgi:hypothetical protein
MFVSVNGTAQSYGTAQHAHPITETGLRRLGRIRTRSSYTPSRDRSSPDSGDPGPARYLPEFEQFEAESFDLRESAEQRGAICKQTGEPSRRRQR